MADSPDAVDEVSGDDGAGDQDGDLEHGRKAPSETYRDIQPSPLPPIAPDGGFIAGSVAAPAPLPKATPENMICLRGPCRHLWQMRTHIVSGNSKLTFDPDDGLRETMPCPICQGERQAMIVPELALSYQTACRYHATQGIWGPTSNVGTHDGSGPPCRLLPGHQGAHHHDPDKPPNPRPTTCEGCGGSGVVADPQGAPVKEPRQLTTSCMLQPGVDTDLTDDIVYTCNHWDPIDPDYAAHREREKRRSLYFKRHPEISPQE